jgi:hypothetical protein
MSYDVFDRQYHFRFFFIEAAVAVCKHRPWYRALTDKHPKLHPAVKEAYMSHGMPRNWHTLLLEWPHQSETDANRLAYTPNERYGEADRQVITTIGKYLNRAFDLPDHVIRDIVARHTSGDCTFKFLNTTADMVDAVQRGPYSCMCWRERNFVKCTDGERRHPYEVYDPKYGWHMAVRLQGDDVVGRALCNEDEDRGRYWVRSYKKDPNSGYSYTDEFLEAWLKGQGYDKHSEWADGTKLALYRTSDEFLAPYIDGGEQHVSMGSSYLTIDSNGEYDCDQTGGAPSRNHGVCCDDCSDYFDEDDLNWVGACDDRRVCNGCLEEYRYVYGRRGNQYNLYHEHCVYVESQDEYYDEDYLSDNNIVELANGDYEHIDNAVYIDSEDAWYSSDDDDIVYDDYNERYELTSNCEHTEDNGWVNESDTWVCAGSGKRYSNAIDPVEIDGEHYHPDHAPETEPNETNEE